MAWHASRETHYGLSSRLNSRICTAGERYHVYIVCRHWSRVKLDGNLGIYRGLDHLVATWKGLGSRRSHFIRRLDFSFSTSPALGNFSAKIVFYMYLLCYIQPSKEHSLATRFYDSSYLFRPIPVQILLRPCIKVSFSFPPYISQKSIFVGFS